MNNNIAQKRMQLQKAVEDNIQKGIVGEYGEQNIEKAVKSVSRNPELKLVHIIDKNGHHTVRWMKPEEINQNPEQQHSEVATGHRVVVNGNEYKIRRFQDSGLRLIDTEGNKRTVRFRDIAFAHPTTGGLAKLNGFEEQTTSTTKTPNEGGQIQNNNQGGLNYELFGTPAERMALWSEMVEDFANNNSKNLTIAYGTGGVGKTYNVLKNPKLKEELEKGEAVKFTGGTTPAGFLKMLWENKDKKIILDDFDMIFKDEKMLNLIANVSRSSKERVITKPTSGSDSADGIPNEFEFNGKIMIISNVDLEEKTEGGRSGGRFEEILTNASSVDLKMSRQETWDLINEFILHKNGKVNQELKFKNAIGEEVESNEKNREELSKFFKENWQSMKELSGRTLSKANAIQNFYKSQGIDWVKKAKEMLCEQDANTPTPQVEQRFATFNDSVNMVAEGLIKSAVIVDRNAENITQLLEHKGFRKTPMNGGFELQRQMNPDYIPHSRGNESEGEPQYDERFATEMYYVATTNMTERTLYETLWKHNGKTIVFDKSAKMILDSDLGNGLLKGALDTSGDGNLAWLDKSNRGRYPIPPKEKDEKESEYAERLQQQGFSFELNEDSGKIDTKSITHPYDIPKNFDFIGRCIFVTDSTDEAKQPIQSRSMIADISTTPEEFFKMAETIADNRERLGEQFSYITKDASVSEYRNAIKFIRDNKSKIHERKFNEEGIQEVIVGLRRIPQDSTEEQTASRHRQILIQMNRGANSGNLQKGRSYQDIELIKAFVTLLNK